MPIKKHFLNISCFVASLALLAMPSQTNAQIFFGFANGSELDNNATIGAATTLMGADGSSATVSIVDVFAPEYSDLDANGNPTGVFSPTGSTLFASLGDPVTTQIQSDDLGVDNGSVDDSDFEGGAGNENRDINGGEGVVIEFDVPVVFTEIDFASLDDDGGSVIVTIEGRAPVNILFDAANGSDIFTVPFGTDLIPAGADITIEFSAANDANLRLDDFTVVTSTDGFDLPTFDFTNADLDGTGVGATTTASSFDGASTVTLEVVDVFATDFVTGATLSAANGDGVVTQIQSGDLGVDNPSVLDDSFFPDATGNGAGNENRDFNDGEGFVFEFDVPVIFTEIDFGSLGGLDEFGVEVEPGSMAIVTIEGVGSFNFVPDDINNALDTFSVPFGTDFIPAGADITIEFSSPTTPSANLRLNDFTVSTMAVSLPGDFNQDGMVDCADLDGYVGNIGAAAASGAVLDIDGDGTLSADDANTHITTLVVTSNGVTGTFPGDLNCNGQVDVLGDAFILIGSLGMNVTSYSAGDIDLNGAVDVLGDAFILIGNLGMSNN